MEKKEPIKVSLSTFFLIIAITVIAVMGYFMYKTYNEKIETEEKVNSLNSQINTLQDKINKVSEITNNTTSTIKPIEEVNSQNNVNVANKLTYNYLKGTYEGEVNYSGEKGKVYLILCENGMYSYEDVINTACAGEGYYTFTENEIVLHQILRCANDPGRTISSDTIIMKLNNNETITDNKLNTTLKKTSSNAEREVDICNTLKTSLDNNFLR